MLFDKNQTKLVKYPADKTDENYKVPDSVTSIEWDAFTNSKNLKTVSIGKATAPTDSTIMFDDCPQLTDITVADDNEQFSSVAGVLVKNRLHMKFRPALPLSTLEHLSNVVT